MLTTPTPERLSALRAMPYHAYLQTAEWRRRRDRALQAARWRCQWPECGEKQDLAVHHRSYERLGEERDEDLQVLCPRHHLGRHEQLETLRRLHWRVIRDIVNSGPFVDFADFVDEAKFRFRALHIHVDSHDLNELLSVALRDVPIEIPSRQPPPRVDAAPLISEREATAILVELNLDKFIREMPTAAFPQDDDFEEARQRAYEMGLELT